MIFSVFVSARASYNRVQQKAGRLKVYLTKPAREGLANNQLIDLLSEHFKVKKYRIRIKSGQNSRNKLIEIDGNL